MPASWHRLPVDTKETCASVSCGHSLASWRMDSGGTGSFFCEACRRKIDPRVERVALAIHMAMGNGWAYTNYGGDEWNSCRDTLMDAASAAIDEMSE